MTDQDVWVIKYGDFEARIDVSQLWQLPPSNVRKLLKLSRMADNPESLESFGPLLERAKYTALLRLIDIERSAQLDLMRVDMHTGRFPTKKELANIRAEQIKDQKRAFARLDKIKSIYEKEFKNYVY